MIMEYDNIVEMVFNTLKGLLDRKDEEIRELRKENEELKKKLKVDAVFIDSIFEED